MKVIFARNVNVALHKGVELLKDPSLTRTISPRGKETIECTSPVATIYKYPQERVMLIPERDANPFFHLFESLWILAGRKDVKWLAQFNSNISSYSDNGHEFHGAYGWRLREEQGDQIKGVIELLKKDPDTRRAVLQIWNSVLDLKTESLDIPCLAGDSILYSPEGNYSLEYLEEEFSFGRITKWPVLSMNEQTREMEFSWCTNVWKSGKKKVIKLTFSDGSYITCTPEHRLYKKWKTRDGKTGPIQIHMKQVVASELSLYDTIWATSFLTKSKHNRTAFIKDLKQNWNWKNQHLIQNSYWEFIHGVKPEGYDIHHKNEDPIDNRLENLELKEHGDHSSEHMLGENNPMNNMSEEQHKLRAQRWRETMKEKYGWYVNNHEIVSIEEIEEPEDVYDFTVEGNHNAVFGTGIVVHNCNDMIFLKIRERKLHITVLCRSNDIIWGAYGANAVQFSILQEYIASMVGVGMGTYTQISDSFHVYTDLPMWKTLKELKWEEEEPYYRQMLMFWPLVDYPDLFDTELKNFLSCPETGIIANNRFFANIAYPMWRAWKAHKEEKNGLKWMDMCKAGDWRMAGRMWLEQREGV